MDSLASSETEVTQIMDLSLPLGKRIAETLSPADPVDDEEGSGKEDNEEKGSSESDQVWGVDSFDESDYSSPDEEPEDEDDLQLRRYLRHVYASRVEMVPKDLFQGFRRLTLERILVKPNITGREYMENMVQVAIDKYNQEETVVPDHIVRVVVRMSTGVKAYITFMAKESPEGELVEYQAKTEKVWQKTIHAILCRPAP
ncbi:unnamed protein product [Microthlaspi erraticum]|uniref:Cystatin domain-containing protein n=1 Tax=Microthlaspi erraticum TaxID=1685480 RepID=A0A6D2JDW6_9BRAS|nr:unnamed protein product [Microthlaspi erraticum]